MKETPLTRLLFREPPEPKLPAGYKRAEKLFDKGDTRNLSPLALRQEKEMNFARKKLERANFEDILLGEAKERTRNKRLDKNRQIFKNKLNGRR